LWSEVFVIVAVVVKEVIATPLPRSLYSNVSKTNLHNDNSLVYLLLMTAGANIMLAAAATATSLPPPPRRLNPFPPDFFPLEFFASPPIDKDDETFIVVVFKMSRMQRVQLKRLISGPPPSFPQRNIYHNE
jgi:hypothetical protein